MASPLRELAARINKFPIGAEKSKIEKVYTDARGEYTSININANFIYPEYLATIEELLTEEGKKAYRFYFKKTFEELTTRKEKKK